ncbi:hypothetical protein [Mucilaginibacter antarcticus]|uniref:hypothetical protein n=1 Tax=Mucilaginibacter antarcticus TaxID=1855725 RepID=UPI00362B796E
MQNTGYTTVFAMNDDFYRHILNKQQLAETVPSNKEITTWAMQVIRLLFPEQSKKVFISIGQLQDEFDKLKQELLHIMDATKACDDCDNTNRAKSFLTNYLSFTAY